jgi:hypothetical protein
MLDWWFFPSDSLANSLEDWCDALLVAFTLAVLIGVIFEYLAEDRRRKWFRKRAALWSIVVAVGLGGEMLTEAGSFWYAIKLQASQGRTIAELGDVAATAKTSAQMALTNAGTAETDASDAIGRLSAISGQVGNLSDQEQSISRDVARQQAVADAIDRRLDKLNRRADILSDHISARSLTKSQHDALFSVGQHLKQVNFAWQSGCAECQIFASLIMRPLMEARVEVKTYGLPAEISLTGIMVRGVSGHRQEDEPIFNALSDAKLNPGWANGDNFLPALGIPTDTPLVIVGDRYVWFDKKPYIAAAPGAAGAK